MKGPARGGGCHVLDVHNLLSRWYQERHWRDLAAVGLRRFLWGDADPLADVFLAELGAFPTPAEVHTDYLMLLNNAAQPEPVLDIIVRGNCPFQSKSPSIQAPCVHGAVRRPCI